MNHIDYVHAVFIKHILTAVFTVEVSKDPGDPIYIQIHLCLFSYKVITMHFYHNISIPNIGEILIKDIGLPWVDPIFVQLSTVTLDKEKCIFGIRYFSKPGYWNALVTYMFYRMVILQVTLFTTYLTL